MDQIIYISCHITHFKKIYFENKTFTYERLFVIQDTQPTFGITTSSPHVNRRLIFLSIESHI